jgi:hypothetical protein
MGIIRVPRKHTSYFNLRTKRCGTIKDIHGRDDLILVTDSQDIEALKDYFGHNPALDDFDGFFVKIENGEYVEVKAFQGILPALRKDLYCIIEE